METFFQSNLATNIIFFVAFIELCFAVVVFLGGKERPSRYFAYASFLAFLWTVMMGLHVAHPPFQSGVFSETSFRYIDMIPKVMHSLGLVIVFFLFCFALSFPENKRVSKTVFVIGIPVIFLFIFFTLFTDLIVGRHGEIISTISFLGGYKWTWNLGPFILLYDLLFMATFIGMMGILFFKQKRIVDDNQKFQIKMIFFPLIIPLSATGFFNIIFPLMNIFSFNWMSAVSQIFWVVIIGYTVIRYNNMNVKHVYTELLILAAIGLLFINLFI